MKNLTKRQLAAIEDGRSPWERASRAEKTVYIVVFIVFLAACALSVAVTSALA